MKKQKLCVSFSAGETSAYMAKTLKDKYSNQYEMIFIFANTGKELEETLLFAHKCDKAFGLNLIWVESITNQEYGKGIKAKVVDYKLASRNGTPFENMIKKHGIPNVATGFCTRELKDYAIRSYFRDFLSLKKSEYEIAIGIRIDEIDRVSPNRKKNRFIYPLIELFPTTKKEINSFWNKSEFRLNIKGYEGNCDFCFKKSDRKLLTIAEENPERLHWWGKMETQFGNFIPKNRNQKTKLPITFFRGRRSIGFFKNWSSNNFVRASDDKFEFPNGEIHELDYTGGCEESCLPFSS